MITYYTPAQAAKVAKCGRSSIMRALISRELIAQQDNKNRWKIAPEDLEKWMQNRPDKDRTETKTSPDTDQKQAGQVEMIAYLKAENGQLNIRIDELKEDRDRWRQQAEELAKKDLQAPVNAGFWARLLGKK